LLFTGCPQDSDDDDDSGGGKVTAPGSDLSYIAYAFGDGLDTVRAVNHIELGSQELVIPKGKTLDLATENVYIKEITGESKIIAQGTILFAEAQDYAGKIEFFRAPDTAKIIADRDFITRNVWIDYFDNGVKPRFPETAWDGIPAEDRPNGNKDSAVIHARWQQIVLIDTFDNFRNYSGASEEEKGYIFVEPLSSGEGYAGKYLAIEAPAAGIVEPDADVINSKAGGLRLYLVGEPVIFANPITPVNLSSPPNTGGIYKEWAPSNASGGGEGEGSSVMNIFSTPLFAYGGTGDGSLTVAGNADVHGGQIIAPGGFTVWGVLKNKISGTDTSAPAITGPGTPVTAWTARLDGGVFSGKVSLLGSITNTFAQNVTFKDDVEIAGPSTFSGATFEGDALFNGSVKFTEPERSTADVSFAKDVIFADNAYLHSNVTFTGNTATRTFYKVLSGLPYTTLVSANFSSGSPGAGVEVPLTEIKESDAAGGSFGQNMVFTAKNVTVKEDITFEKDATFEGNVTFSGRPTFGTDAAAAIGLGETTSTTVIKGLAVFNNGADFGGTMSGTNAEAKAYGNTVIIEEAEFKAGSLSGIGKLVLGNSTNPKVTFSRASSSENKAGAGTITIPPDGGIAFKDDTLTFIGVGGTIDGKTEFTDVKVSLEGEEAKMTFGTNHGTNFVGIGIVNTPGALAGGFEINGKVKLDDGEIVGLGSTPSELKATGGIVLEIPKLLAAPDIFRLVLDNSIINLTEGGTIAFGGTGSNIYMKNGANLITNSAVPYGHALQSPTKNDTGVIIATSGDTQGTRTALVTGSLTTGSNWVPGTLGGGGTQWVPGSLPSDTYSANGYVNLLYNGVGFVLTPSSTGALTGSSSAYTTGGDPIGSIAVFKDYK
jgi:hypothetical protein